MTPAENLLGRIEGVRESAPGQWVARCPAHDDRNPSLSVREESDGTVLLHCFAGCAPADVLHAVGLSLGDLFERQRPPERAAVRRQEPKLSAGDVVRILADESLIVTLAAEQLAQGQALSAEDRDRLSIAWRRLEKARAVSGL